MTSNITPRIQMCAERERQLFRKHWTISSEHLVFGRPFVERFALSHGTFVCLSVLSCLSVCNVGGLWPNSYIDYRMPLDMQVGLVPGDVVLDGNPAPPPERGTAAPLFSAHVYCGYGRPSQLLLSSCFHLCKNSNKRVKNVRWSWKTVDLNVSTATFNCRTVVARRLDGSPSSRTIVSSLLLVYMCEAIHGVLTSVVSPSSTNKRYCNSNRLCGKKYCNIIRNTEFEMYCNSLKK